MPGLHCCTAGGQICRRASASHAASTSTTTACRVVPRQRKAAAAVQLIRETTDMLIKQCKEMVDAEEQVRACGMPEKWMPAQASWVRPRGAGGGWARSGSHEVGLAGGIGCPACYQVGAASCC